MRKLVDVLVVENNSLEGFEAPANVAQVFRGGCWVARDRVVQSTPPKLRKVSGPGQSAEE